MVYICFPRLDDNPGINLAGIVDNSSGANHHFIDPYEGGAYVTDKTISSNLADKRR